MEKILAQMKVKNSAMRLVQGDITERPVEAIVNAANSFLQHGGGVAGAIVRKGGQSIQDESNALAPVDVGSVVITGAGRLRAKYVIHAVGPRMGEGDEDEKLRSAVRSVLRLADDKGIKSVSMPAISSGIFGFPKDRCAEILVGESASFIDNNPDTPVKIIEFCVYDDATAGYFTREFKGLG